MDVSIPAAASAPQRGPGRGRAPAGRRMRRTGSIPREPWTGSPHEADTGPCGCGRRVGPPGARPGRLRRRTAWSEVVMARQRRGVSSSALCREVLAALDRVFLAEGPDEPDLALNIAYVRGRRSLQRLASARPWTVPADTASAIREAIAAMLGSTRPGELERKLQSFPGWVLRSLDRRDPSGLAGVPTRRSRRQGDLADAVRPAEVGATSSAL